MEGEPLVRASEVVRELGIPRSTLYRLVATHVIPTHPDPVAWHRRQRFLFRLSEVRAALGLDKPPH